VKYRSTLSSTSALCEGGCSTPRSGCFTREKDSVPIVQGAGWLPGPVWTCAENLASHRDSIYVPSHPKYSNIDIESDTSILREPDKSTPRPVCNIHCNTGHGTDVRIILKWILKIGRGLDWSGSRPCEHWNEASGECFWPAEQLLASQERLFSAVIQSAGQSGCSCLWCVSSGSDAVRSEGVATDIQ